MVKVCAATQDEPLEHIDMSFMFHRKGTVMADIIFVACNARYSHVAFALKTLRANLSPRVYDRSETLEFTIQNDPVEAADEILQKSPKIIGLSVYLWSLPFMRQLAETIHKTRPEIRIFIGGPEVAMPEDRMSDGLFASASVVICGEGERAFSALCVDALCGREAAVDEYPEYADLFDRKVIYAPKPDVDSLVLPYEEYTDDDLKHRILYVETGRGCPYRCAFCLSSGDKPLRYFSLEKLFKSFKRLIDRGARSFKFLDRTLNASLSRALEILAFFMPYKDEVSLHFEMVPHEIPAELLEAMAAYPPGAIQIEFGVQTLTPHVAQAISRRLDADRLLANLKIMRESTRVHIHADLIAGLPGETFAEFAAGFERLKSSGVQEIQLGILKRLRGSPLDFRADEWGLVFSSIPPYEVLQTPTMDFAELTAFKRFARYYDVLVNNANYPTSVDRICAGDYFAKFNDLAQWIYVESHATQGISQTRWVSLLFRYMTEVANISPEASALCLIEDYLRSRKEDIPPVLRPYLPEDFSISACKRASHHGGGHIRQEKHLDIAEAASPRNIEPSKPKKG